MHETTEATSTIQLKRVKILDHGFIEFVELLGAGDRAVVQAARVSTGSHDKTPEEDARLIAYMLRHGHGTPFEHVLFKFHVRAPIFVARQWLRHRSSSYNEESARYKELRDDFYMPAVFRAQGGVGNKQGSGTPVSHDAQDLSSAEVYSACKQAFKSYERLLQLGVAREQARIVLPVGTYTEWFWTVNARMLMDFIRQRSDQHAQWEIRQYSHCLWRFFAAAMPQTARAFLTTLDLQKYVTVDGGEPGLREGDIGHVQAA